MASPLVVREPWHRKFQGLMPFRVREILLVSSAYDAFVLEEDGPLTEQLFTGYSELNLSSAPRITHVPSAAAAMEILEQRRFDLVITVVRVEDSDVGALSARIKNLDPDMPIVLLVFDEADLSHFPDASPPEAIERTFLWTGDAGTLIAAIKLVEDLRNVAHDTSAANVHVILVIEDQLRAYSSFLALLYPELMSQSHSMILEGYNDLHRLLRMRARPKILLANDYEEASTWYGWLRNRLLALITDLRFPREGEPREDAGFSFVEELRAEGSDAPVLILSAEANIGPRAEALGAWWVEKSSTAFPTQIRRFLTEAVGFGDFVFRLPSGREVERARNMYEMEQVLQRVPAESIAHHALRHDFSVWLKARSMFALAAEIRPRQLEDFEHTDAVRNYLVNVLERARDQEQEGVISDVSAPPSGSENRFVRVGRGSIGGKGRGVAFVNSLIVRRGLLNHFPGLQIRIPRTVVLGTETFERYMEGAPPDLVTESELDLNRWYDVELGADTAEQLAAACSTLRGPLAVRSSSVLEDSRFTPFAGVYATYMLPNNHPQPHIRYRQLSRAIKAVYASVYSKSARTYIAGTPHALEDQRMAIAVQLVVGRPYGHRFYPLLSGVAQSRNYYPLASQKAEDGVAIVALGLGQTVVSGGTALRFSPGAPRVLPQFPDAKSYLRLTQTKFYAMDLSKPELDLSAGPGGLLGNFDLDVAEEDGTLADVASVYSPADDVLRDRFDAPGPRVVTFNNILRWNEVPLAEALSVLLELLREGMGGEVEIEFALDYSSADGRDARLYILQLRPMPPRQLDPLTVNLDGAAPEQILIASDRSLGHGVMTDVRDVIYVKQRELGSRELRQAAVEVRSLAARLRAANRPFVLIGPGRWGTSDARLGVPVEWRDIVGAKVIIETPLAGRHVEPSQGTHFFHNLTAARIGYLTLDPAVGFTYDEAWLDAQSSATETALVRHVELNAPMSIQMDGMEGRAVILKGSTS